MAGAIGQTLQRVLVHDAAVLTLPALLAQARAVRAEPVAGARRMRTVNCVVEIRGL